jgi:hypothetical protein
MMEALSSPKRRLLQEPHVVTSQKTPFFIVFTFRVEEFVIFLRPIIVWIYLEPEDEAICPSEMLVDFQQTTRRRASDYRTLQRGERTKRHVACLLIYESHLEGNTRKQLQELWLTLA